MIDSLNYQIITTANKPTSVYSSARGRFFDQFQDGFIISKCNRLEAYRLKENNLELLGEHVVHGRVVATENIKFPDSKLESLIVLTDKKQFGLWSWNQKRGVLEIDFLESIENRIERPLETSPMLAVDPLGRCFVFLAFQGSLHIVCSLNHFDEKNKNSTLHNPDNPRKKYKYQETKPQTSRSLLKIPKFSWSGGKEGYLEDNKMLSEPFLCRIEELKVLDIKFLNEEKVPILAILYEDSGMFRHVKTYRLSITKPHPNSLNLNVKLDLYWQQRDVHITSNIIQPAPLGGLVVVGSSSIVTINHNGISNSKVKINPFNHSYLKNSQILTSTWINDDTDFDKLQISNNTKSVNLEKVKEKSNPGDPERLLFGDDNGNLWLLLVKRLSNLQFGESTIERLGEIPIPTTIIYLKNGILFIGSHFNDSRLVKLHEDGFDSNPDQWNKIESDKKTSSFVENLQTMKNLAPITDMCIIRDTINLQKDNIETNSKNTENPSVKNDPSTTGLDLGVGERLIACSGARSKPSLRVVRSGIGIKEMFTCKIPSPTGIYPVAIHNGDSNQPKDPKILLFLSFPNYTTILEAEFSNIVLDRKISIKGYSYSPSKNLLKSLSSQTIWAGNTASDNTVFLVTKYHVSLLHKSDLKLVDRWSCPVSDTSSSFVPITCATGHGDNLVVSLRGGFLIYFEIENNENGNKIPKLIKSNEIQIRHEISCMNISQPFSNSKKFVHQKNSLILAVGVWDLPNISLYNVPTFDCILELDISSKIHLSKDLNTDTFLELSKNTHVASTETPEKTSKMKFISPLIPTILSSNQFMKNSLGGLMCILESNSLIVANFERVQNLHIDTIPLPPWESPYKIAHHIPTRTIALCTIALASKDPKFKSQFLGDYQDFPVDFEKGKISILDDSSFNVLVNMYLKPYELPESISSIRLEVIPKNYVPQSYVPPRNKSRDDDADMIDNNQSFSTSSECIEVIALGTSITLPEEDDATRGSIYLLQYDRKQNALTELCKMETDGAVYSLVSFKGMLAASVNNKVVLYGLRETTFLGNRTNAISFNTNNLNGNIKMNSNLKTIKLEIMSIEPTHVVSLHLAVPEIKSISQDPFSSVDIFSQSVSNNDFLGVGDLMSGVSVIQHKYLQIRNSNVTKSLKNRKDKDYSNQRSETFSSNKPNSIRDKTDPNSQEIYKSVLEEITREYFTSWVTSLACTITPNLNHELTNLSLSKTDKLYSAKKSNSKSKEHVSLKYLVGENGLNLYSLSYSISTPSNGNKSNKNSILEIDNYGSSSSRISGDLSIGLDAPSNVESEQLDLPSENHLQLTGRYHLGDMVNVILPGSITNQSITNEFNIFTPELLIGTISGAIHMSVNVHESKIGRILDRLQVNMGVLGPASYAGYPIYSHTSSSNIELYSGISMSNFSNYQISEKLREKVPLLDKIKSQSNKVSTLLPQEEFLASPLSKWSHAKYRTFINLNKSGRPFGFIDGDLILLFLDYPVELQQYVFSGANSSYKGYGSQKGNFFQMTFYFILFFIINEYYF
ncbi:DNA damage-binding protein 1a [Smittium mucronatum]|uniref:DNA damage-binding protein 1a n=1 Tax=Smittium mucronatum TaxID=133383 RepID=A0A1R0GW18_9FUNG|nr:DNA damage-binding protein 1a [Smittium mucronatum]